jgi:hypothetical protein
VATSQTQESNLDVASIRMAQSLLREQEQILPPRSRNEKWRDKHHLRQLGSSFRRPSRMMCFPLDKVLHAPIRFEPLRA